MGVEGVHIVETRMFCTVCLKSSCLLICVHSWSLDLSQTLIITNDPNSERGKNWSKTMGKKNHPMSPVQLLLRLSDPLHGSKLVVLFAFFWCARCFCHLGPKMPQNPWKNTKNKKFHPMSPVHFLLRPSPWVETLCFFYGIRPNKNGT